MFYAFLKRFFTFATRQFFRRIQVRGAAPVEEGPLLVVCNHPNYVLDSLLVGQSYKREFWFMAKATLFSIPGLGTILRKAHVIPVYRRQDNPNEVSKNEQTFAAAIDSLSQGRGVALFPEGTSKAERRLLPLKTGAARIALQAEAAADFKLGLKIQALGLTYSSLQLFKSSVTVRVAEPLIVKDFETAYRADAVATVRALTEKIEENLRAVTVEVPQAEYEELVEKITALYASRGSALDDFERMKLIAQNVAEIGPRDPTLRKTIEDRIDRYLDLASVFTVGAEDTLEAEGNSWATFFFSFPVVLGALVNIIPYRFISWNVTRSTEDPVEFASKKFVQGMAIFPLWYLLLSLIAWLFGAGVLAALSVLLLCVVLGLLTNQYLPRVRLYLLSVLWPGSTKPLQVLKGFRDQLILELEQLRVK